MPPLRSIKSGLLTADKLREGTNMKYLNRVLPILLLSFLNAAADSDFVSGGSAPSVVVAPTSTWRCGQNEGVSEAERIFTFNWIEKASSGIYPTKEECRKASRRPLDAVCQLAVDRLKGNSKELKKIGELALKDCEAKAKEEFAVGFSCAVGESVNGKRCDLQRTEPSWHCVQDIGVTCELADPDAEVAPSFVIGRGIDCIEVRPTFPEQSPLTGGWELKVNCELLADFKVRRSGRYGCTNCPT